METLQVIDLLGATQIFEKKLNLALIYSGLRLPQFRAMVFLEKSGKITVSDLSRYLNVTRATMSVLVNQLLKAQNVVSITNRKDKRSFYIKLTESGLNRLAFAKSEIKRVEQIISKKHSSGTIAILNAFSKKMLAES